MSSDSPNPDERDRALRYLEDRFGIPPEAFSAHRLLLRGEHLCAVREEAAELWDDLDGVHAGLKLLKVTGSGGYKPSTRGMQVFGTAATRNVFDLSGDDLRALVEGRSLPGPEGKGFVLFRHRSCIVGVGLLREGALVSQLPRSLTMHLRFPGGAR